MHAVIKNIEQARKFFRRVEWERGAWDLICKPYTPKKSPQQRSLLHIWIRQIHRHLLARGVKNLSEGMVKDLLKRSFGPKINIDLGNGRVETFEKSTEDYTHEEYEDFLWEVQAYAATDLFLVLESRHE